MIYLLILILFVVMMVVVCQGDHHHDGGMALEAILQQRRDEHVRQVKRQVKSDRLCAKLEQIGRKLRASRKRTATAAGASTNPAAAPPTR
jgi:hypothetical protein